MDSEIAWQKKRSKSYISTSTIILFSFATAFLSRLLDTFGAPSTINFLHFATVPFAFALALSKTRTKNREQIDIIWQLLIGLLILFGVMLASALLNNAGIINVILDFLLLGEPFLLLVAIVSIPMSLESYEKFRKWIVGFCFFHTFLAFLQNYGLRVYRFSGGPDNIQGVFYRSGAGHVVGASVAVTFGLYYVISAKTVPIWMRAVVFLATFWHMLLADAKQVLLSFIVAWIMLLVTKFKDIVEALKYIIGVVIFAGIFNWCVQNLEAFRAFNTWMRPEIYGPDGEATKLKMATFRVVPTYYESTLHWVFGLGPGHTVGRLGGWMLDQYWNLLGPLGATIHPASKAVWAQVVASWLGDQSSMFSPLFGWAGIWGDLGFAGLGAYLYLGFLLLVKVCRHDFSKFLVFNVFATGLVFSQMEEPGYMLFIALLIGLQWQEIQINRQMAQQKRLSLNH